MELFGGQQFGLWEEEHMGKTEIFAELLALRYL